MNASGVKCRVPLRRLQLVKPRSDRVLQTARQMQSIPWFKAAK